MCINIFQIFEHLTNDAMFFKIVAYIALTNFYLLDKLQHFFHSVI